MKLPENLRNTSGFGKGLPPARYVKGQEGTYSLSFQNEFDHAVWYAAGTPKTPGGKSDKQKEVLGWLMSQGLTYEELKEHRKKILDVIKKQVKTSVAEGSGDIDVPNVNPQFADKEEPEEDILDDLPGDLAASLAAFAAKKGASIPSQTAEKAKKSSSYKSNTKLLGAITEKLSKIQGSLDAVAQGLDRQNTLLQTNIQTNIAIVDSVVESNNVLETKFDALLAAFNAQAVASQQYYENLERAGREYVQDQQRDVAGSVTPSSLGSKKSNSNIIGSSVKRVISNLIKRKAKRLFFGKSEVGVNKISRLRSNYFQSLLQKYPILKNVKGYKDLTNSKIKLPIESLGHVHINKLSQRVFKTSFNTLSKQNQKFISLIGKSKDLFVDPGGKILLNKLGRFISPKFSNNLKPKTSSKLSSRNFQNLKGPRYFSRMPKKLKRLMRGRGFRGVPGLLRKANPYVNAIFSAQDYAERKAAGQTEVQAISGVGGSLIGGVAGGAAGAALTAKLTAAGFIAGGPVGAGIGLGIGILTSVIGANLGAGAADKITGADQMEQGSNNVGPSTDPAVMIGAAKSFVNQLGPMGEEVKVQFTPEIARLEKIFGAVDPNMESPVGGSIEGRPSPFKKKKTAGTIGDEKDRLDINFDQVVPKGPLDDFLNFFNNTIKNITNNINAITTEGIDFISGITSSVTNPGSNIFNAVLPQGNPRFASPFGPRWGKQHGGIDIGVDSGSPVTSLVDGEVTRILSTFGAVGGAVFVKGADGMETVYGHVDPTVAVGQKVKKGETIATVKFYEMNGDNTHLHLERRPAGGGLGTQVNPLAFVQQKGKEFNDARQQQQQQQQQQATPASPISSQDSTFLDLSDEAVSERIGPRPDSSRGANPAEIQAYTEQENKVKNQILIDYMMRQIDGVNEPSPIDNQSSTFDVFVPSPLIPPTTQPTQQPIMFTIPSGNNINQLNNLRLGQ